MSPAPQRLRPRYPSRSVQEVEDQIARQHQVVTELSEMRHAATDLRAKEYLRKREKQARAVLDWLIEFRTEMQQGPQ